MKESLRRLFRAYQNATLPKAYLTRQFIRLQAGTVRASRCLDIGAGISPYRPEVEHAFGTTHYISSDLFPTDRTTLVCDVSRLPLRDQAIELVCGFDMISCVPDYLAVLREAHRVLMPGGWIILTYAFSIGESGVHDYRRWTIRGMEQELTQLGFEVLSHSKRGGIFFTFAMFGATIMNGLVPGTRDSWRAGHGAAAFVRIGVANLLMLPFHLLGWVGLLIDRLMPSSPFYFGGMVLARRLA
jgi:hypothetical protein